MATFLHSNRSVSDKLAGYLPHTRIDVFQKYSETVAKSVSEQGGQVVVDVGAGQVAPYAPLLTEKSHAHIVGVDLSLERMAGNIALDEKRVADVVREGLPCSDGEADIITSRSVLEHLSDVAGFVNDCSRVLKRGGYSIHLLSGRFTHIALLNRLLPERFSHRLLFTLHPSSEGAGGFRTFYDRCYYRSLKRIFVQNSHEVIDIYANFGSNYFYFFVPLFVIESLYLMMLQALHLKSLAVSYLIVARRV